MLSVWEKHSFYFHSDILIVGGGLTGLLTAIFLKQSKPSLKVRILEKGLYPSGASAKNAGFACFGSVSEILDDISNEGESKAFERVVKRYNGLQKLLEIVEGVDIGLEPNGGYEVFDASEKALQQECVDAIPGINNALAADIGANTYSISSMDFGMRCSSEKIFTSKESGLNSGLLLKALIQKALSLEVELNFGCEVLSYENTGSYWKVSTSDHDFRTDKLVLATNGFTSSFLDLPIIPGRGQLLLTEPIPGLTLKGNFHLHKGYFYFRNLNGSLLLGGGRHLDRENEATTDQNTTGLIQRHLKELISKVILPDQKVEIAYNWAGTMAFGPSNEKETLIKHLDNGLYVGARLGGMGVALSSHEAEKLSQLVLSD